MKTKMRGTSLETYRQNNEEDLTSKREIQVYKCIRENPMITNKEISNILNLPINCVTGRTNSLVKKNKVYSFGTKLDLDTKRPTTLWAVLSFEKQKTLIEDYKNGI